MSKKRFVARVYLGDGTYRWVGRFDTKREANRAKAQAMLELEDEPAPRGMTVDEFYDRFMADYERDRKQSSVSTVKRGLKAFRAEFGGRELRSITRTEAKDWARGAKLFQVRCAQPFLSQAVSDDLIDRNPLRGLAGRYQGRGQDRPPSEAEVQRILDACSVLKEYAPRFRAFVQFAMYTALRPGELFALEWGDVDFDAKRVRVARRVYQGVVDVPKSGKARTVALTPPARDALLTLPKDDALVFRSKRGRRMSQNLMQNYWTLVLARAGLDFDFYLATRHYCAWYLRWVLRVPRDVAEVQMGHAGGDLLRRVYEHADVSALGELDRAFEVGEVRQLRAVSEDD